MKVERKNYSHLDAPIGPYVHAVSYNGLLFLSGFTAFNTPARNRAYRYGFGHAAGWIIKSCPDFVEHKLQCVCLDN